MIRTSAHPTPRKMDPARRPKGEPKGEAALRAAILDALGEAVVAADIEGHVIYWNDAATDLFGWAAPEVIGAELVSLLPAEGSRGDALAIIRHLRLGRSWVGDFFVRHRDGRSFPIHVTASPVRDADGQTIGMVGVGRDLSAQRQAEEALRRSEERLELVHRATVSVIWEWDLRSGERQWNDSVADAFGYDGDEATDTAAWWEERIHPQDRARVANGLWNALAEGRRFWTEEYRFRRGDGSYAIVFDRGYVALDGAGQPLRAVGTMLDLTERRRSHEAARFLSQAGMLLDLSIDYTSVLPAVARLAAQTVADACVLLVGTPHAVEEVVAVAGDPVRQPAMDRIATRLRSGALAGTFSERVLRTGQSLAIREFTTELLGIPDLDEELRSAEVDAELARVVLAPISARGETLGVVMLARGADASPPGGDDVRVAEELGRRIGLGIDNARLFHSAELARRAKSDFLSVISHELRTPLTAVMGYADLLAGQISGQLNTTQQGQVERIRAGADKLLRVIEGILAYARLEAGQERAQPERIPVDRLLERVRDVVGPHAAERGVTFTEDAADVPGIICADLEKAAHVLVALLINAVKFSGTGGTAGLRVAAEGDTLICDVSDDGPGISEHHLPNLFSPFWQGEQPEVRRTGGAGLGLSVARRLARVMGGEVDVLATSPAGTTFRLSLPGAVRAG